MAQARGGERINGFGAGAPLVGGRGGRALCFCGIGRFGGRSAGAGGFWGAARAGRGSHTPDEALVGIIGMGSGGCEGGGGGGSVVAAWDRPRAQQQQNASALSGFGFRHWASTRLHEKGTEGRLKAYSAVAYTTMAASTKDKSPKVEKTSKKDKSEKKSKKDKKSSGEKQEKAANAAASLLADKKVVNPALSSLFAAQPTPPTRQEIIPEPEDEEEDDPDAELSEIDEDFDDEAEDEVPSDSEEVKKAMVKAQQEVDQAPQDDKKRKRKRKDANDDLEDVYMRKLEKEEAKDAEAAAKERAAKRQKGEIADEAEEESDDDDGVDVRIEAESDDDMPDVDDEDEDEEEEDGDAKTDSKTKASSPPPKHETQQADTDLTKANRTVFLGNVSTAAITSKSSRRVFIAHLSSFFSDVQKKHPEIKAKLESLRFRSTPYAAALPKKAAYAKKELMDATTKSTNAYAVYSSPVLAREAARRLNATKTLDRHLRVDEIAHPAKVDHKRCVFIGNLGFVDDESNIQAANAADGREVRKPGKQPADHEEGLWRTMSRHGEVESVRVIRDSVTRVGKGIAYVQFKDENSVEKALLDNEKKFPPMLPRKLRVSRAKAQKRNAKPGSGRPGANAKPAAASGYKRKVTEEELAQMGRQGKLLGKAGAAAAVKNQQKDPRLFVFEGHRATNKQGNQGLKLGGKGAGGKKKQGPQRQGKPTDRSAKRAAAYKAAGSKKGKSA
ncbi:hypothetical protein Q7P37_005962 [Cladosporium fusiforme]